MKTLSKLTSDQHSHIDAIAMRVQQQFEGEQTGHDWWHMLRVWRVATRIAATEGGDQYVTQLAALLHDIADHKFTGGDRTVGPRKADELMTHVGVPTEVRAQVCDIIPKVSFSGSGGKRNMDTPEGMAVQDADRLDAMGAIAIARTFIYGGVEGHTIYEPTDSGPTADERRPSSAMQHFDDKLFTLYNLLNTDTARELGRHRHDFLRIFVEQFQKEWNESLENTAELTPNLADTAEQA